MAHTYPRIGSKKKPKKGAHPNNGQPCVCCATKTTGSVEIQVSYMRGDDEREPCCGACQKTPESYIVQCVVQKWRKARAVLEAGEKV